MKPTLLIVEDSRVLADLVARHLEADFQYRMAYDGQEAIRLLRQDGNFSAMLLDLNLPKADGFEVMRVLNSLGLKIPVIVLTSKPRHAVEKDLESLGVKELLNKPADMTVLRDKLKALVVAAPSKGDGENAVDPESGHPLPFLKTTRCCFICGYDRVPVFIPRPEGIEENWNRGAYPVFSPRAGFAEWDGLKTLVSVCPYCFFASSDLRDFARKPDEPYPYSEESKKILARSLTVRKRLVPESHDEDHRFDTPYRKKAEVFQSFLLAEKCCNGLILAGKMGAYADAGIYCTFMGAMEHPHGEKQYQEAFISFQNQLKHKDLPPAVRLKTYYFTVVLNMLLSRTAQGREVMAKVGQLYQDKKLEEVSQEERDWLLRIDHAWKHGIDYNHPREIS